MFSLGWPSTPRIRLPQPAIARAKARPNCQQSGISSGAATNTRPANEAIGAVGFDGRLLGVKDIEHFKGVLVESQAREAEDMRRWSVAERRGRRRGGSMRP